MTQAEPNDQVDIAKIGVFSDIIGRYTNNRTFDDHFYSQQ